MASMFKNQAFYNLGISLGLMMVARKIPFENPDIMFYTRTGYIIAQVIILGAYYYAASVIKKKNDLTLLKFVQPPNQMTQEPSKVVTMTVRDYDLAEVSKSVRNAYMAVASMCFLHFYWHYTQPLFQQGLLGVKALYDAKELKLHVFDAPAEGDLKRPFKGGGFFSSGTPLTDAKSISEAEKSFGTREDY